MVTLSSIGALRAHRPFSLWCPFARRCGPARQRDLDGDKEHVLVDVVVPDARRGLPVQTRRANSNAFEQEGTPERQIHRNAMEVSARTGKS